MKLKYFTELDGVRAIAALMVMVFHFFNDIQTTSPILILIKKITGIGQSGVSLFFVLSGFLITRILINSKNSDHFFLNFYIRRALRIFPLYYLFLVIFYFLLPLINDTTIAPFGQQIYFWVYLQNFAITFNWNWNGPQHFWSLGIEEHFYFIWPLLIFYLDKERIKIAIFVIILLAFLVRLLMVINNVETFYFTFSRMDELAIGALLAIWEFNGKLESYKPINFIKWAFLLLIPTFGLWFFTSGKALDVVQIVKYVLMAFCYFCFIGFAITIKENHFLKKFLRNKFFSFTGRISYGLYVYHPLCFLLVNKHLQLNSIILSFIVSFVFCFLVSSASFYLFESKFLGFKNKLQKT
ncbi:acyltransferase [Flavobacterium sp.]|jgi:peptidoglycan/LPS O-acetylase OafA/YrhL|uniref:acyltransferase family protein n=1 Tax=Flavobacterium sp. TaxID=239 RepID=UPI002BBD4566|nr:acyltransferase [Flavobacterium sp.]HQA73646.1 acyltransferase [Flavobacterium sp.]